MYKALKSAQNDIQEVLLKLVDEIGSASQSAVKVDTSKCPRGEPCQCALITQAQPQAQPQPQAQVPNDRLEGLENTLQFLHHDSFDPKHKALVWLSNGSQHSWQILHSPFLSCLVEQNSVLRHKAYS